MPPEIIPRVEGPFKPRGGQELPVGKALVIGAGVSGLTTAWLLIQNGFAVEVVAEKFAPEIVSVVAGALWEWPPAVCGYHHDQRSLWRSKKWCMISYRRFEALAAHRDTGVAMRLSNFYFPYPIESSQQDLHKMRELESVVDGFFRDSGLIASHDINPAYGLVDAYRHLAPVIDTDRYMVWLRRRVEAAGATVTQGKITGRLADCEEDLALDRGADVIVNCSGLGAAELHGRPMYPLRGALVRVRNGGMRSPIIESHCVSHDERHDEQDIVFIVPRSESLLVLGGLAEADEWSVDIGLHNHEPVREMYDRCTTFMPSLADMQLDTVEPVRVGLRPFRHGNVCVEREPGTRIVHNYAHGGAGFTLSWGCAAEVAALATEVVTATGVKTKGLAR
jgi:D-amino-acid oxidase